MLAAGLDLPPWNLWPELLKAAEPVLRDVLLFVLLSAIVFIPFREGTLQESLVILIARLKKARIKFWGIELKAEDVRKGLSEERIKDVEVALVSNSLSPTGDANRKRRSSKRLSSTAQSDKTPLGQDIAERISPPTGSGKVLLISTHKNDNS